MKPRRARRCTISAALCVWLFGVVASHPAWPQSIQERAAAAERRWAEYQEVLESSNPVARAEALRAALADENVGIRNNALWAVLQRRNVLPVAVVLEAGGRIGPGEVPNLEIVGLRWDPEHRSFAGRFVSHAFASQATGEVLEGHLQIKYDRVKMPIRFGQPADIPLTNKDFAIRPCTVVLTVKSGDNSLNGPLRCEGMPQTLQIRMPLD